MPKFDFRETNSWAVIASSGFLLKTLSMYILASSALSRVRVNIEVTVQLTISENIGGFMKSMTTLNNEIPLSEQQQPPMNLLLRHHIVVLSLTKVILVQGEEWEPSWLLRAVPVTAHFTKNMDVGGNIER